MKEDLLLYQLCFIAKYTQCTLSIHTRSPIKGDQKSNMVHYDDIIFL
jgi:hypothetical protein